jgi:hypothetical protein
MLVSNVPSGDDSSAPKTLEKIATNTIPEKALNQTFMSLTFNTPNMVF